MTKPRLNELVAAPHTPFHPDGVLNLAAVEVQAEHLLKHRITAVFVGGSTGECHSLMLEERRALARRWMEVARGTPLRVVVHVGANSLGDVKALATQAGQLGALAIAALAPSYFRPRNLAELVDWCAETAAAAPQTPFYFYDIPALTGVSLPMPGFLAQAADRIPTLAGIKFTNPNLLDYQLSLHVNGGAFDIPWGMDESLLAALAVGAVGAVGSSYNFAAPLYHRLLAAFRCGDLDAARSEQFCSVRLIRLLQGHGYFGAAKAVMKMIGVDVGPARMPHENPGGDQLRELRNELEALGFFEWITSSRDAELPAR